MFNQMKKKYFDGSFPHLFSPKERLPIRLSVFTASVHLAGKNNFNGNIAKTYPFYPDALFPYF